MSDSEQSGAGRREVAYRLFAAEYDDADFSYSESDEERAPNYVVTPTGARVNRLFVVGVLTEVEEVSEDVLRARVVDPTGAFVLYAGQYQPDEQAFLDGMDTPAFVAVTGKARTFQPDDSDRVFTSIRPETITEVSAETRDRWTVQTAEQTLTRVGRMATALSLEERGEQLEAALAESGVDEGLAEGIALAIDHYDTSPAYLAAIRDLAVDAARLVAGEIDEVESLSLSPDAPGDADLDALTSAGAGGVQPVETSAAAAGSTDSKTGSAEKPSGTAGTTAASAEATTSESSVEPTGDATGDATATATDRQESPTEEAATSETTTSETTTSETATSETDVSSTATDETVGTPASETTADEHVADATGDSVDAEATGEPTSGEPDTDDIGDFEPGEFELPEEEREEIEEEYGTEFQSGTEVEEPGEADIETPDANGEEAAVEGTETATPDQSTVDAAPETEDPATESSTAESSVEEPSTAESSVEEDSAPPAEDDSGEASDEEPEPEDIDLEDAVIEVMEELDDGDGADREELLETIVDRYGASPDDVEAAIQDALMDGRCYEPDDTSLKPI